MTDLPAAREKLIKSLGFLALPVVAADAIISAARAVVAEHMGGRVCAACKGERVVYTRLGDGPKSGGYWGPCKACISPPPRETMAGSGSAQPKEMPSPPPSNPPSPTDRYNALIDELDRLWHAMTDEEQAAVEGRGPRPVDAGGVGDAWVREHADLVVQALRSEAHELKDRHIGHDYRPRIAALLAASESLDQLRREIEKAGR